jgi:hypothetical protein
MPEEKQEVGVIDSELLFTQLVLSFQAAAWQQMGKVPSMVSGKIERSLEMAKFSIDMLGMLEDKTKGNLSDEESKFLSHILFELRMNFLEEQKKGTEHPEPASEKDSEDKPHE